MTLPVRRRETNQPKRPVQRYEPFRELQDIQEHLNELLRTAMPGVPVDDVVRPWVPPVDIEETEDEWILEAELPGVDKKDINVEVRDSEVVISGDVKERERKGILRRRTRKTGEFEFRVTLPGPTDADAITADVKDGVLAVRIPTPEEARPRRIEVHGENGSRSQG
jgi:HSP20 family protein